MAHSPRSAYRGEQCKVPKVLLPVQTLAQVLLTSVGDETQESAAQAFLYFFISFPSLLFSVACRGVWAALSDAVIQPGWNTLSSIILMLGDP